MSEPQLATMLSAAEKIVKRADRRFFFLEQEMILKEIETISALGHKSSESQLAFLLLRCTLVARPFCKLNFQEVYDSTMKGQCLCP